MRIQNLQTQLQCFCPDSRAAGQPLLTSFFWEISVFSRMTYLRGLFTDEAENERDSENLRRRFMEMIDARRAEDSERLRTLICRFFGNCDVHVRAHFGELASGTRPRPSRFPSPGASTRAGRSRAFSSP